MPVTRTCTCHPSPSTLLPSPFTPHPSPFKPSLFPHCVHRPHCLTLSPHLSPLPLHSWHLTLTLTRTLTSPPSLLTPRPHLCPRPHPSPHPHRSPLTLTLHSSHLTLTIALALTLTLNPSLLTPRTLTWRSPTHPHPQARVASITRRSPTGFLPSLLTSRCYMRCIPLASTAAPPLQSAGASAKSAYR